MVTTRTIDVADFIDRRRLSRYQLAVALLCTAVLLCDNIDLQAIAYSGPRTLRDLEVGPSALGAIFSAGLFGMMIGALGFGPLADRLGRRTVMIIAVPLFAILTMATALANSPAQLIALRFLAGLGFGGAMPNAMSMIAEYMPRRSRLTLLGIFGTGFTFGGALSGFIAVPIVTHFGWRAVFVVDGAIAGAAAMAVFLWLPESLRFLALRGGAAARLRAILSRIDPGGALPDEARFTTGEAPGPAIPMVQLFTQGRARLTIPLWIMSFCFLLDLYFIVNWTPVLARQNGIPLAQALMAPAYFQVGATMAGLGAGALMDRIRPGTVLIGFSLLAAAAVAAFSLVGASGYRLAVLSGLCGLCVVGGMTAVNLAATTLYPTASRTTGIGWELGIGRLGSFVGPLLGGALLALHWAPSSLFVFAALPPLLAAAAAVTLVPAADGGAGAAGAPAMPHPARGGGERS